MHLQGTICGAVAARRIFALVACGALLYFALGATLPHGHAQGPDNANLAPGSGVGKYRYVDGGVRYLLSAWPRTEPKAFDPAGAVTFYDNVPPKDKAPGPYPCEGCPSSR